MSAPINDGGPAFPNTGEIFIDGPQGRQPQSAWGMEGDKGMSLRDWFAGQALAGMLANAEWMRFLARDAGNDAHARLATHSYGYADAMLAARKEATK